VTALSYVVLQVPFLCIGPLICVESRQIGRCDDKLALQSGNIGLFGPLPNFEIRQRKGLLQVFGDHTKIEQERQTMALSRQDLENGIRFWLNTKDWPRDFHNALYSNLARSNAGELFTDQWLDDSIAPLIKSWKAYRPMRVAEIVSVLRDLLPEIRSAYSKEISILRGKDISEVSWPEVKILPEIGYVAKPYNSAVFPSKFSHWIAPELYPVADNEVLGIPSGSPYQEYWLKVQHLWRYTDLEVREEMIDLLVENIRKESSVQLVDSYPWAVKITELCLIGGRH